MKTFAIDNNALYLLYAERPNGMRFCTSGIIGALKGDIFTGKDGITYHRQTVLTDGLDAGKQKVTMYNTRLKKLCTIQRSDLDTGKVVPHKIIAPDQVQRMKRGLPYIMMTEKGAVKITPKNRRDANGRFARKGKHK